MTRSTVRTAAKKLHIPGAGQAYVADDDGGVQPVELFVAPNGSLLARAVQDPGIDQAGQPDPLDPRIKKYEGIDQI